MVPTPLPATLQRVKDAGHKVFASGPYDLNIVGIRAPGRQAADRGAALFNDRIEVHHLSESGAWVSYAYAATTDPTAR